MMAILEAYSRGGTPPPLSRTKASAPPRPRRSVEGVRGVAVAQPVRRDGEGDPASTAVAVTPSPRGEDGGGIGGAATKADELVEREREREEERARLPDLAEDRDGSGPASSRDCASDHMRPTSSGHADT